MFCLCNPLHTIVAVVQRSDTQSFFLDTVSRRSPRVFFSIVKIYALCKLRVRAVKWLLRPIQLSFHRPYRKRNLLLLSTYTMSGLQPADIFRGRAKWFKMIVTWCCTWQLNTFLKISKGGQLPGFPPPPRGCGVFKSVSMFVTTTFTGKNA